MTQTPHSLKLLSVLALSAALLSSSPSLGQVGGEPFLVELPGLGHDIEVDTQRQRLYVSVPATDEIAVISLATQSIVDSFFVGQRPHGIDLSDDGSTLFVALNASGSVAALDIESGSFSSIAIGAELDDPRTWDVIEGKPGYLYASANPGSSGFAYIVQIDRRHGNAASRVASNRIIRCGPVFEDSPDDEFLYVGECFSPNSLYKLDLGDPTAPIILEDDHGSVDGTDHLEVNPTGTRIYLRSGQVLRTASFLQDGLVTPGAAQVGSDETRVYVATPPGHIFVHDTGTYLEIDDFPLPCSVSNVATLRVLPNDSGLLVLADDLVCGLIDTHFVSLDISPPSGSYFSTQTVDVVIVIGTQGSRISSFTFTIDGIDRTAVFRACAIRGTTPAGRRTFRCPNWLLQEGAHQVEARVQLEDGTLLEDSVSWDVEQVIE